MQQGAEEEGLIGNVRQLLDEGAGHDGRDDRSESQDQRHHERQVWRPTTGAEGDDDRGLGDKTVEGLPDALTTWFGPPTAA